MEKTYRVLNNTEYMSIDEIKKMYDGYWVFLVKAKLTDTHGLLGGVPVVVGKMAYDGAEDGIYEQYKSDEYIKRVGTSFLPNRGFISCLNIIGGPAC